MITKFSSGNLVDSLSLDAGEARGNLSPVAGLGGNSIIQKKLRKGLNR
jgi:hypothetical protein